MKIQSQKNLNITLLFDSNIDLNAVANKQVFGVASVDTDKLEHVIIEGPNVKIFQFPKLDYNFIFESKRLIVNDKSGVDLSESKIVSKMVELYKIVGGEVVAYGFNFDYLVTSGQLKTEDLLGAKLSALNNVRDIGASLRFDDSNGVDIGLDIKPVKDKSEEFVVHVNVNHNKPFITDENRVNLELVQAENTAKEILSKI